MRLRLTVQRNGLPAIKVLWNVPDTHSPQAYTITRMLEDVNHIIPLEAEHWGLEHYVVELGGFECLHFTPVIDALKDDDHVLIRPLLTAEVRARTLTGREQISDGGQHLIDGVPFGRPYLRTPNRPAVNIPPRKRRRLNDEDEDEDKKTDEDDGEDEDGGDNENDLDATDTNILHAMINAIAAQNGMPALGAAPASSSIRSQSSSKAKSVRFRLPEVEEAEETDEDEDEDEDDEDFALESGSDEDSSSDDSTSEGSESDAQAPVNETELSTSASDSDSNSDSNDTSSDSDSDNSPPDVQWNVPPGMGKSATRRRNRRRSDINRLRKLKKLGMLPETANLDTLRQHEGQQQVAGPVNDRPPTAKRFVQDASSGMNNKRTFAESFGVKVKEDNLQNGNEQDAMTKADQVTESDSAVGSERPMASEQIMSPPSSSNEEFQSSKSAPSRRLQPDTSAIKRMLKHQIKVDIRPSSSMSISLTLQPDSQSKKVVPVLNPMPELVPEAESAADPDFWKTKIELSAFECWEEQYELSAPPFPFKQHWDPGSQMMRQKSNKKRQKNSIKQDAQRKVLPVEVEDNDTVILDYDGVESTKDADIDMNGAIEAQLRQDVAAAAQADLPGLPADINSLPDLSPSDMKKGAIVASKFFGINPETISPEISPYKTAIVQDEGDSGSGAGTLKLQIALRDLPKKKPQMIHKGKRVYEGKEGLFMDEGSDDDDDGIWHGMFSELVEPKLLRAA